MPTLEEFHKSLEQQQKFIEKLRPLELSSLVESLYKVNNLGLTMSKISGLSAKNYSILNFSNTQALSIKCQVMANISMDFASIIDLHKKYKFIETDFLDYYSYSGFPKKKEKESAKSIIVTESSRIKSVISKIYQDNEKLYKLTGHEFEQVIAELLSHQGFDVELTKQTRDGGFDIIALKYVANFSKIKYLVECKKYSANRPVGVEVIRAFKDVILTEGANKGIIATTSYFSTDSIKKKSFTPLLLDFVDKDEVLCWVNNYLHS